MLLEMMVSATSLGGTMGKYLWYHLENAQSYISDTRLVEEVRPVPSSSSFDETPAGVCIAGFDIGFFGLDSNISCRDDGSLCYGRFGVSAPGSSRGRYYQVGHSCI